MTAKDYLMQLQTLDTKITQKVQEVAQLRGAVLGRGMQISDMKVQTSPQNSQEDMIAKYLDMESKINSMIDKYVAEKDKIINQIHELADPKFIQILYDHYVPDENHRVKSLEQISVDMKYNYTYTCELHGQALLAFSKIIRTNQKIRTNPK
ncbi:MAG: hypothetical protein SOU32_00540 [Lachnospiraceae bacterium]|nr:hypothetical protein [Lachnospiraceae bacterium]